MTRHLRSAAVVAVSMVLSACSYGHKSFDQAGGPFQEPLDFVLQVDDDGKFWDPTVANRALEEIATQSQATNTVVVLFIHGWHHNADRSDANARDFAKSLEWTRKRLDDNDQAVPGVYRQSRLNLTGHGDIKVIGVYVGWRGKSLPMPLDYATIWGRKAAAERVGQGDLRSFLLELNEIYQARSDARENGQTRLFMGMASFGHSLGGQVLFKAVAATLEQNLEAAVASRKNPSVGQAPAPLSGFGDIVVLINPALEASQYERLHRLQGELEYQTVAPRRHCSSLCRRRMILLARFSSQWRERPGLSSREGSGRVRIWCSCRHWESTSRNARTTSTCYRRGQRWADEFDANWYTDAPCQIIAFDLTRDSRAGR